MDTWSDTLSESVVMLMDGFFAVTDVLEPHRLFLPAALPGSGSLAPPSVVPGGVLLPARGVTRERRCYKEEKMFKNACTPTRTMFRNVTQTFFGLLWKSAAGLKEQIHYYVHKLKSRMVSFRI